jgi:hypothetical protein
VQAAAGAPMGPRRRSSEKDRHIAFKKSNANG